MGTEGLTRVETVYWKDAEGQRTAYVIREGKITMRMERERERETRRKGKGGKEKKQRGRQNKR